MQAETDLIVSRLAGHLTEALCLPAPPSPDTDLLAAGLVDSLMIMDVVTYIESTWKIHLEPSDIRPNHFRTVRAIGDLIAGKLTQSAGSQLTAV